MKRRELLPLSAAVLLAASFATRAQVAGKDYIDVSPPQPGGSNGQVAVLEFFSYGCPHCYELEPTLHKWKMALPRDVAFRRVPVSFGRPEWAELGRMYLTLNAMGLTDKLDMPLFEAVHKSQLRMTDEKTRNAWLEKQGVDVKKYAETSRSFGVDSMVRQSEQLLQAYKASQVPAIYVDGRYLVGGDTHEQMMKNTDLLVAKARAEKKK